MIPRRALILAAGLGSRLRPLTWKTPKPLMPIWGVPLLDHAITTLLAWGVEEFAINVYWNAEAIEEHLARHWPHLSIRISRETEILGTGGALLPLRDFFCNEEAFWIFNADIVASMDGRAFAERHLQSGAFASLWMTSDAGPRTVELAHDGLIRNFASAAAGSPGTASFCGVHLVSGRIYDYLPTQVPSSSINAYRVALIAGERVQGLFMPQSFWADSGTPHSYLALHRDIRRLHAQGLPGGEWYAPALDQGNDICAETDAFPSPHTAASCSDCILAPGTRLAEKIHLHHCITGPHTCLSVSCENALLVHPQDIPEPRLLAALSALQWNPQEVAVEALEARGSDRTFYRLQYHGTTAILATHGSLRPENNSYAPLAKALTDAGIRVPSLLAQSDAQHWIVMQDLGQTDLLATLQSTPFAQWEALYLEVLQTVADLHILGTTRFSHQRDAHLLQPAFSEDVYRWERELFATHFLQGYLHLPESEIQPILHELEPCAQKLLQAQPVLIHRDLQSTNLFLHQKKAWMIDFQGTRFGAAAYDLASLLCDPYVALPSPLRTQLLHHYASRVPWGPETLSLFPYAAIQRLIQALGAYGRLSALPGTERFAQHIPSATHILLDILPPPPAFPLLRKILQSILS